MALLARVYLYLGKWTEAGNVATAVINSTQFQLPTNLNDVFLGTSKEAIWQLKPVNPSRNTFEGRIIVPASSGATPTYLLTPGLLASLEPTDKRKLAWTKQHTVAGQPYFYPYKYKVRGAAGVPITEFNTVLRLAEMYLIRAEALARQDQFLLAQNDLNLIRGRAGIAAIMPADKAALLAAIESERRKELFAEWGHRWFDLIRTGRADSVLAAKGATWQSTDQLWPLPQDQINLNPALTQNPGY